jgi:broad specificity phosphatase PhoE
MNELIGGGGIKFGQPNFTDIFPNPEDQKKYHDSPLSEVGIEQARALNSKLRGLNDNTHGCFNAFEDPLTNITNTNFLGDLDLVVVSPLTRALQTIELSLYDHILNENENGHHIPIVAVAAAAERLYLVSDVWKARSELMSNYPFVDFDAEFHIDGVCSDFTSECASQKEENLDAWHFSPTKSMEEGYSEWRPHGQGQKYACLGEPSDYFDRRMSNFYYWLESREEKCIAIVCHAGVIEWMTSGEQFYNCELRVQAFSSLQPRSLQGRKTQSN